MRAALGVVRLAHRPPLGRRLVTAPIRRIPPAEVEAKELEPTTRQMLIHGLTCAIPMAGFGFMDNLVMIQAGDLIDNSIGVTFGLATLTSAAFGQIFSDVSGVLSGSTVETAASRLGLPKANLTVAQYALPRVKMAATMGQCIGVVLGCLLGMTSLLFMDLERADRLKKQAELSTLFETLLNEGAKVVGAERCTLFLVDHEKGTNKPFLWSKSKSGVEPTTEQLRQTFKLYDRSGSGAIAPQDLAYALDKLGVLVRLQQIEEMISDVDGKCGGVPRPGELNFEEFEVAMRKFILNKEVRIQLKEGGTKNWVVTNGKILNIQDVNNDKRCNPSKYKYKYKTQPRNLLLGPVTNQEGEVIGIIEMVNKQHERVETGTKDGPVLTGGFDRNDEKLLALLCSHASTFIHQVEQGE